MDRYITRVLGFMALLSLAGCGCADDTGLDALSKTTITGGGTPCSLLDQNDNGVPDGTDIARGTSLDVNDNCVPDEVEIDCDRDGTLDGPLLAGVVWLDADRDGVRAPGDFGVAGVTLEARDAAGQVVDTIVTDAMGMWRFDDAASLAGTLVRMTSWPAGHAPAFDGPDHGGEQQIVIGPACDLAFALHRPSMCDAASPVPPRLATSCFVSGRAAGSLADAFVSIQYDRVGGKQMDGLVGDLGTVWGEAYQVFSRRMFTSAFLKRHSGVGPLGFGGVYILDYGTAPATLLGSFDLQGVLPANGGAAIDLGTVTRTGGSDYTLPTIPGPSVDIDALDKVGKIGFGDIDVTEDGRHLFLVNLHQRALIRADVSARDTLPPASRVEQWLLEDLAGVPAVAGGVFRPWALAFRSGRGYLGGVATGETSQSQADLTAYVLSFDPVDPSTGLTTELVVPLQYERERTWPGVHLHWRPWARTYADVTPTTRGSREFPIWPQAIVSDIEFADDGAMILGLMDRAGHQFGHNQYRPVPGGNALGLIEAISGGDIIRACRVAGAWALEGSAACPTNDPGTGHGWSQSNDGPNDNGEFFYEDNYSGTHMEISTGGLAVLPGVGEVAQTVFDPFAILSQGLQWLNTTDGTDAARYELVPRSSSSTYYGKGNGLGDLELICEPSPIELGGRVFVDRNGNDRLDGGDRGLLGVTVDLYHQGVHVGTTTTGMDGCYRFTAADVAGRFEGFDERFEVRIELLDPALGGRVAVAPHVGGDEALDSDGDPALVAGALSASVRTPTAGAADHTVHFGVR